MAHAVSLGLQLPASRELKLICCDSFNSYNDLGISIEGTQAGWLLREQEVHWVGLAEPPSSALSKQLSDSFVLERGPHICPWAGTVC